VGNREWKSNEDVLLKNPESHAYLERKKNGGRRAAAVYDLGAILLIRYRSTKLGGRDQQLVTREKELLRREEPGRGRLPSWGVT